MTGVTYLPMSESLGYADGNNYAFDYINKNYIDGDVFVLNSDVKIKNEIIFKMSKLLHSKEKIAQVYCSAINE